MVVGVMELTLAVPAGSLKEKRSIIRKIMGRTRSKFPISIGEVAEQDTPSTVVLGVAYVSAEARLVEQVLMKVERFIEELMLAEPFDRFVKLEYY